MFVGAHGAVHVTGVMQVLDPSTNKLMQETR